ncbi:MAG: YeaC family protein [Gammaproteobacteria bacterium]|nr:YeaC family protein [Gammaproteobacteria bacterium]
MTVEQLLETLTPQIVDSLRRAIELGKWPNGVILDQRQIELCTEALIRWEYRNLNCETRSGYISVSCEKTKQAEAEQILRWKG